MALTPINLSNLLTFSTDQHATRTNAAGLIEPAVVNQPRFDFHPTTGQFLGILCEESRNNWVLHSESFDNAVWSTGVNCFVNANVEVAPNGSLSADLIGPVSGQTSFNASIPTQTVTKAASAITYTTSCFVKSVGVVNSVRIMPFGGTAGNNASVVFNLTTGAITSAAVAGGTFTNASAQPAVQYPNGWWRVNLTFTTGTETDVRPRFFPYVGNSSFTGDGTSGIYVWGAQLEVGNVESSYIPTTTSANSRSADIATIPVASIPSFNLTEGTFVATADTYDPASDCTVFAANNGTQNEQFDARFAITAISCRVRKAGVNEVSKGLNVAPVADSPYKVALAYKLNDTEVLVNGTTNSAVDTSCAMPTSITTLEFGARTASSFLNGHIKSLTYYPTRLTATELEQVTTL